MSLFFTNAAELPTLSSRFMKGRIIGSTRGLGQWKTVEVVNIARCDKATVAECDMSMETLLQERKTVRS